MVTINSPFMHILAASLVAGFALQTEWAVAHDFDYYEGRVFAAAFLVFLVLQGLRKVLRAVMPEVPKQFDEKYAEVALLSSIFPLLFIISNDFALIVAIVLYAIILVKYCGDVLGIKWCSRLWGVITDGVARLRRAATGSALRFAVSDDTKEGVVTVTVRTSTETRPTISEVKRQVSLLYQALPDHERFQKIRVDIGDIAVLDESLPALLDPISHYAKLTRAESVAIVGTRQQIESASTLLPSNGYSFEQADE